MADFLGIVVIAFLAQLTVLPGEKVQFIIAGLSTRYHPLLVVGAAGTAFAGWTAVEIAFGSAVQQVLPGAVLQAITAGMFLLFAVLLVRSAPAEDEGFEATADGGVAAIDEFSLPVVDAEVPDRLGGFVPIFLMMATGEFGDKTQLITITLALTYGATPAIWVGEMLAIIPVSLLNAYFFHRFTHLFDVRKAHFAGGAIFAFFGLDAVLALTVGVSVWGSAVSAVADALLALA